MESRGIGRAQAAAVRGVAEAGKSLEKSAAQVANVALERQKLELGPAATVEISERARNSLSGQGDVTADIASAFVGQSVAKQLMGANVAVLRTVDETLQELTDGLRKKP